MKPTWKDCTSYSRDEPHAARTPRSWSISVGKFYIIITKGHLHHPGWWVVTCEPFFAQREIGEAGQPAELIQARALALLTLEFEAARVALELV